MTIFNKKLSFYLNMEENNENPLLKEKEEISVKIINNDVENINEIGANMEFNVMIVGKEGKSKIFKNIIYRSRKKNST